MKPKFDTCFFEAVIDGNEKNAIAGNIPLKNVKGLASDLIKQCIQDGVSLQFFFNPTIKLAESNFKKKTNKKRAK